MALRPGADAENPDRDYCRGMAARNVAAGPRPPLADRLTPAQWLALDAVAAVLVALWVVFDLRLRHGFRFELPLAWFGVLGAAVTLPAAVRRLWPIPVLAVVAAGVATLTTAPWQAGHRASA
jgi:hypothetical protein